MPIDIATGDVELAREDFALPGRVPLKWTRHFRTTLLKTSSPLAPGWTTSMFPSMARVGKEWHFTNGEGDLHVFADPDESIAKGNTITLYGAFLDLVRSENRLLVTQWDVDSGEIHRFVFEADRAGQGLTLFLVGIEDVSGDGLALIRDASGRLRKIHQRIENRTVTLSHSPEGRIDSLALATNNGALTQLVRYEYDEAGRLSAVIDRRGLANRYEYDAQSRVTREILKDGSVYSYKYDDRGRCIHFSGLDHYNEKRLQFLETARTTIVTNSYGRKSVYQYLPDGQIVYQTDPSGNRQSTVFDEHNRIVAKVDSTGATTRYTYDNNGNRNTITDPLGHIYRFTFNSHHQPLSVTNPLGKSWHRKYDSRHRLNTSSNPMGAQWTILYDSSGSPARITDPLGSTRQLRYVEGLVREATDWMGNTTSFSWDEFGRITERVGPVGDRTAFRYDSVGNPVEVQLPDGGRMRASYDAGDNLITFTNAKGYTTRFRYGSCRRLLERVDPSGRAVRYEWGTEPEWLDRITNAKGETFSYFRNDQGYIVRERSFDNREQTFEYDGRGHCVSVTNGNGERIHLKRDAASRLVQQALPNGVVNSYQYDSAGRIIAAVCPDIAVRFEHDDAGRVIREVQGDEWVSTEYNLAGEVTHTQTSLGHEVRYEVDPNGRVRRLSTAGNYAFTFERDPRGLETSREMPGGLRIEQRFDSMGRLSHQRVGRVVNWSTAGSHLESRISPGSEMIRRDYRYDPDGFLLSVKDGTWGTTEFAYDPAERIVSALRDSGLNEHFEYDATDNLTRIQKQGTDSSDDPCVYGPGNRLLQRGNTLYEYDQDGRLVQKTEDASNDNPQVWRYTWDAQNQLRNIQRPDGQEWEYKYDALSRRIAKHGPTSTRRFLWSGDNVIHETQDRGQQIAWVIRTGSFAPLARVQDGELVMVINDHLGTPREILDTSGRLRWTASHSVWGEVDRRGGSHVVDDCPIRYQGQWFDEESGLHYNRLRYYDPTVGRYISPDLIRAEGGNNLYKYVLTPMSRIDPFGLTCTDITPEELEGKTRSEIRDLADEKGLVPRGDPSHPDYPRRWVDPVTGEDRLRIDRGHIDKATGLPYDNANAAVDHVHGYDSSGNPIVHPDTGDKHFPTTGE